VIKSKFCCPIKPRLPRDISSSSILSNILLVLFSSMSSPSHIESIFHLPKGLLEDEVTDQDPRDRTAGHWINMFSADPNKASSLVFEVQKSCEELQKRVKELGAQNWDLIMSLERSSGLDTGANGAPPAENLKRTELINDSVTKSGRILVFIVDSYCPQSASGEDSSDTEMEERKELRVECMECTR
jgi:hypothetical protein